jgi:hypothetical protein
MDKKFRVDVDVRYKVLVWAENEEEALQKGQSHIFEEKVNHEKGDLITGYRITTLTSEPMTDAIF